MLRWSLLLLSGLFFLVSLLTAVKAPTLFTWKLAIVAGEYGYLLAAVPLALITWSLIAGSALSVMERVATLLLCGASLGLFVWPTFCAYRIGKQLPRQLSEAFGPAKIDGEPFSFAQLFRGTSHESKFETRTFSTLRDGTTLSLDFYRASRAGEGASARPCVVVIHGGGWDSGDRTQLPALNSELASAGYAVATIDYRLAPSGRWPAQREDVLAAIVYLKEHASELGIDAGRFVLLGRSAGGQIAEAVAYRANDPAIRGVIALYSPADMNFAWKYARRDDVLDTFQLLTQYLGGPPENFSKNYDEASPYLHVQASTPRTLLVHGQLDTLVWHRQSERLAARLAEEKVSHFFLDLPWATHALDFNLHGPGGQLSTYAIKWFLSTVAE